MKKLLTAIFGRRLLGFVDKSAWILILPAMLALYVIDPSMSSTLLQWSLFGIVLSGVSIIISRTTFPHIDLSVLIDDARRNKNTASAIIVAAIIIFVGLVFFAMIFWAKT